MKHLFYFSLFRSFGRCILSAPFDFAVGGQAVIEGVMMRSPHFYTVSVRSPDGKIKMKQESFMSLVSRVKFFQFPILKLPLIRGVVQLVESMIIGYRSLSYSNAVYLGTSEQGIGDSRSAQDNERSNSKWGTVLSLVLSVAYVLGILAFTLFILKFLPLLAAEKAAEFWPRVSENYFLFNAIDGLTKITVFLSYILLISIAKDIRRVFQYHGAEHKSIWTYENGLKLTVENARKQSRFHPRCGTSFIFIVILMSVFVYTLFPPADTFLLKLLERIAVIPIIAGVSYELLKLSARFQKNPFMNLFTLPGLLLQRLTTKEPEDAQLEVALHSLKESLAREEVAEDKVFGGGRSGDRSGDCSGDRSRGCSVGRSVDRPHSPIVA